jgi:hypothetical protein
MLAALTVLAWLNPAVAADGVLQRVQDITVVGMTNWVTPKVGPDTKTVQVPATGGDVSTHLGRSATQASDPKGSDVPMASGGIRTMPDSDVAQVFGRAASRSR